MVYKENVQLRWDRLTNTRQEIMLNAVRHCLGTQKQTKRKNTNTSTMAPLINNTVQNNHTNTIAKGNDVGEQKHSDDQCEICENDRVLTKSSSTRRVPRVSERYVKGTNYVTHSSSRQKGLLSTLGNKRILESSQLDIGTLFIVTIHTDTVYHHTL